ncbi:hypothetical protein R1flu_008118 [Riccia fluitans]|uniref:Uncharacterized protein n=1 Tax=Riccia fluitans TaxID=41844 RepID=A0ABD1YAT0_9MARC
MQSIFDSYVNPNDDPNVQPLVKGLDADDFSVDKFFGLQDPTSPDDVQASPDFEEDLRTIERLRLQEEVRNLGAEPQRVTRSTRVRLDYEPTILPDVPPTDNLTRPVTLDLSVDACKDRSSPPPSQIVPIPALVDLTQYASSSENEGSEDQGWPCKNDLTKADLESMMYKGCYLRGDVINMYINEAFLKKPREQLHNMFYVNTLWFTKASELGQRVGDREQGAGGRAERADALRMAARRAASALRAGAAALLTAALWAVAAALRTANTLKRPRGRFRVPQWEKERVRERSIRVKTSFLFSILVS